MSKDEAKIDGNQDVDLLSVSKGIGNFFRNLNTFFYRCIRFMLRNALILGVLFIVGAGLGYWLDKIDDGTYETQMIVAPNFGSTDYLYAKVDQIDSKLKERDTAFLSKIGVKKPKNLTEIKIVPVVDVFKFVSNSGNETNYKLIELMAQDGDIKKIVADKTTSKNYPYHMISFTTKGETTSEMTVTPLLNYFNDNDHYKKIQKEYLFNVHEKLRANDTMIGQIDGILGELARGSANKTPSVYINETAQVNDVIKTKDELVKEQGLHRVDLIGLDKVIKDNSIIMNIKDESGLNGKMKIFLPLFFIFIFLCVFAFRAFYKSQSVKNNPIA